MFVCILYEEHNQQKQQLNIHLVHIEAKLSEKRTTKNSAVQTAANNQEHKIKRF